jgi:hypothetical protein
LIVIAGDSWGTGEISSHDPAQIANRHTGLQFFLEQHGHEVRNVARRMSSNFEILQDFKQCLLDLASENRIKEITGVFIFQTEWPRDFHISAPEHMNGFVQFKSGQFWQPALPGPEFISLYLSRWQRKLSDLAVQFDLKIGLIGGCADTMWLSKFTEEYPGLYVACQSVTNLCVNNSARIDEPVHGIYLSEQLVEHFKNSQHASTVDIEFVIQQIEQGLDRMKLWESNPDWFYPDGRHANRRGHERLFEYLNQSGFI